MSPKRRVGAALAFVAAELIALIIVFGPVWGLGWTDGFRGYFANDQMSYAAIATNVATGNLALVEPFTLTGTSTYPSLWYQLMGLVALATGASVWVLWQVMGALAVMVTVFVVGWTALRVSSRWWAPALPGLALLTGTLALQTTGDWFTLLGSHAVLWGPFGSLFTLNAEVVGMGLVAIAMCLLLLAHHRRQRGLVIAAAALIGVTANVQTYAFLTGSALAALTVAVTSVLVTGYRRGAAASGVLAVTVITLGTAIAGAVGPLPLFALLIATLAPAAWPLMRAHFPTTLVALIAYALLASPQVVRTLVGVATGDPFLTYRQASTRDLGVPLDVALLAAAPLILMGLACALVVARRRQPLLTAMLITLPTAWVVLTLNDRWGFTQEPYRFTLELEVIGSLLLSVIAAWSLAHVRGLTRGRQFMAITVGLVSVIVWVIAARDVTAWWHFASAQGVLSTTDDRAQALRGLLDEREGLVMPSQCDDPRLVKLIHRGPVAFYNAGLAWPADEPAFKIFQDRGRRAGEDVVALRAAGVRWVVTDSACPTDWTFPATQDVIPVAQRDYALEGKAQTLRAWLVQPG